LNGARQFLIYANDVNLLGENINTIKGNKEVLLDVSKEIVLEIYTQKNEVYVHVLSPDCRTRS
jgi:hypothetical protein